MAMPRRRSEKVERLAGVPLFRGLARKDLDQIARRVDVVEIPPKTVLAEEGRMGHEMGVIVEGSAVVRRKGRKVATLGPGDVYGEMSLLDGQPRSASVIATDDMTLLVMHRKEFASLLDASPLVARKLLTTLSHRLREADRMLVP